MRPWARGIPPPPPPSGDTAHSPPLQVIYSGRWAASSSLAARDQTAWSCGEGVNAFAWAVAPPSPPPPRREGLRRGGGLAVLPSRGSYSNGQGSLVRSQCLMGHGEAECGCR